MKDLLLNTGRRGGYNARGGRSLLKRTDPDLLPKRLRTQEFIRDRRSQGDRLKPLYRFLERSCGRPWATVYREICEVSDARSLRGFHLRQHVHQYVQPSPTVTSYRRGPFFVDDRGLLQKAREQTPEECAIEAATWRRLHKAKIPPKPPPPNPIVRNTPNHWWERIKGLWYEFTKTAVRDTYVAEERLVDCGNGLVEIERRLQPIVREHVTKRQVNSRVSKILEIRLKKGY